MTKIYLPTEIGVKGEGSPTGIDDANTPDVKEVGPTEDPAVKTQPEFYKKIYKVTDLTLAEQHAGVENTRNQAGFDEAPKEGEKSSTPAKAPIKKDGDK